MTSRWGDWFRNPLFLLCLTAGLLAFVVQSGELGTADTMHRLQTTHWLWTSQPQVFPNEYPEFGLHGRDGKIFSWYGIGQSLLMLPADLVGTWISHWRIFADYEDDPAVRSIVVSYSTSILVNVLTALIAFRFLRQLRFDVREAIAGILALMFCTTHLHYTQNMQENNYIMLLTLIGFSYQLEWLRSGNRKALFWGSAALGLNLLTRVTTALDLIAAGIFLFAVLWFERRLTVGLWQRVLAYCKIAVPIYICFAIAERLYSYYRFGSFLHSYIPIFARESRMQDPSLPANFPWSTPFHEGVLGALFKPEKSIFLFDPLLVFTLLLFVLLWRRLDPEVRAYAVTSLAASCRLHRLLCALYVLGRRFCVGRPVRLFSGRNGGTSRDATAASLPRAPGTLGVATGHGIRCGEPGDSSGFACVLAAARDLPDGNVRASHVCDCAAFQKYRGICPGKNGRMGTEHGRYGIRPVGLRAYHDVELPSIRAAACRSGTAVGGACDVRRMGNWARGTRKRLVEAQTSLDDSLLNGKQEDTLNQMSS